MAKVKLTSGFSVVPEGDHVFSVEKAEYDEDFGQVSLRLKAMDGKGTILSTYRLLGQDGEPNAGALGAFSALAIACGCEAEDEVDPADLVGCVFEATVFHTEGSKGGRVFANLRNCRPHQLEGDDEDVF